MGTIRPRSLPLLCVFLLLPLTSSAAPLAPVGFVEHSNAFECLDAARSDAIAGEVHAGALASPPTSTPATLFPLYDWPLAEGLRDGYILGNYVDDDATAAIRDYEGLPHSYNGHNGTDIALYNFRLMDRGKKVIAGADGIVTLTTWNRVDRNTGPPYPDIENRVIVRNADGSYTWYLHLRRYSVTVEPGESVTRGTVLGLTGSSGFSTDAHLHFEVRDASNVKRDPWNGPNNPLPSLWISQLDYVGDDPLWIADVGVTTEAAAGGNLGAVPITYFKERMSQPAVIGANEPYLPVFIQLQGRAGDSYRIDVRRPDGSLFAQVPYTLPGKIPYGWHLWAWNWNGLVAPSHYGVWTVDVVSGSTTLASTQFEVGAATVFGPRFTPTAGRSFRVSGISQSHTLSVSPLGGPVSYSLIGAPGFVTLTDSVLTIGTPSDQPRRSLYFQAVATDAGGRRDTAWFHVVDPSKPTESLVDAPDAPPATLSLGRGTPNPFMNQATIPYALSRRGRVDLAVFDVAGRRMRGLVQGEVGPGARTATWDGRDESGRVVDAGIYFLRLAAEGRSLRSKVVLLH